MDVVDIDHVAIRVTDLDRALAFSHDRLGLPVRDRDRSDAGDVPSVAVVAGGCHVHLVPTDDEIDVGGEHRCLLVRSSDVDARDELDARLDHLREHEVEPDEPRKRYGAYGRALAASVRDPDGRRVELKVHRTRSSPRRARLRFIAVADARAYRLTVPCTWRPGARLSPEVDPLSCPRSRPVRRNGRRDRTLFGAGLQRNSVCDPAELRVRASGTPCVPVRGWYDYRRVEAEPVGGYCAPRRDPADPDTGPANVDR